MPPAAPAETLTLPGVPEAIRTTKTLVWKCVQSLSTADTGYFGPGSVSWRVFSHPSYGVSGIAAVLVQALHPTAVAVVEQHTVFWGDAWRRAHLTADYVFTITFSSQPVADAAAERVRRIHRQVKGTDPVTGRAYRADDADLLLWVHAIHTEYALRGYEEFGGSLAPGEADRFVREQLAAARLVGLDPGAVPASRAELRAYIGSVEGLEATEPARRFGTMLLKARMPLTMRPFWALHLLGAAALLPDPIFRAYQLPRWLPRGPIARTLIRFAFQPLNLGFLLFRPVRRARAKLRLMERLARPTS